MTEQKVTVIDSIMGSGKTSWAIAYMNNHPDDSFIFVTPFLSEVERIKQSCHRPFYEPQPWGCSKHDDFNRLLEEGRDIATTHATFCRSDARTMELLKSGDYTLIIDEAVDPLMKYSDACNDVLKPSDIKLLINEGFISIDADSMVHWIKPDYEDSKYWKVAVCAKNQSLFYLDKTMFAWQFPPQMFSLFRNVFVMTYMFKGSLMYPFFQVHGIDFDMVSVGTDESGDYCLRPYSDNPEDRAELAKLITIFDDRARKNMFNYKNQALSRSWYDKAKPNDLATLKNYLRAYIRSMDAPADRVMWTTYKDNIKDIKGKGYTRTRYLTEEEKTLKGRARDQADAQTLCHVACNSRATNSFSDRDVLAYLINFYPNEYLARYYTSKTKKDGTPVEFSRDLWSLSNFLQWIFRSAIRNGQPITIYIPSTRMRGLLLNWLLFEPKPNA